MARDHAVDKDTHNTWNHDEAFEPEELFQLVRSKETEDEMDEPEKEEA